MSNNFPAFRKFLSCGAAMGGLALLSLGAVGPALAGGQSGSPFDDLPNAHPGECFARVMIPAQYETRYQDVVVDEGGSRIEVSAPRFGNRIQQYQRRDEGVRYVVRQPVYKTVHERVMVRPGYDRLVAAPAQYRTVTEQVQVAPSRTAWKPGKSLADWSGVRATRNTHGEVYCLVKIPAQTRAVQKRVLVHPQSVRKIWVAPVYRTITRQILVDRGGVQEVAVPGQVGNLTVQELVQPAGQRSIAIPPRTRKVAHRVVVAPERYDWIRVLCKTNATPAAISGVQGELQHLGYYHAPVDGQLGLSTETAIRQYQQAVGIPHAGYLSLDTISALHEGRTAPARAFASASASASAGASAAVDTVQAQAAPVQLAATQWRYLQAPTPQSPAPNGNTELLGGTQGVYREGQIISRIPAGQSGTGAPIAHQGTSVRAPSYGPHLTWPGKT